MFLKDENQHRLYVYTVCVDFNIQGVLLTYREDAVIAIGLRVTSYEDFFIFLKNEDRIIGEFIVIIEN